MWKSVYCHASSIKAESANAYLVQLPGSEWRIWHLKKIVKFSGKSAYKVELRYTDDFSFKAFRNGKGKYNKMKKIDEKTMSSLEFEKFFAGVFPENPVCGEAV